MGEKNIYQKLVEVRKSIDGFKKDAKGYGYKYVSGSQVLSAIKDTMDKEGVVLSTNLLNPVVGQSGKGWTVSSTVSMIWINAEKPDDRLEISWFMAGEQKDPSQAFGSALTYMERYFLLKFFGIPTDEDDPDNPKGGDSGSNKDNETNNKPKTPKLKNGRVTPKQTEKMWAMVKEAGADVDKFKKWIYEKYNIESTKGLLSKDMDEIYNVLDQKITEKNFNESERSTA